MVSDGPLQYLHGHFNASTIALFILQAFPIRQELHYTCQTPVLNVTLKSEHITKNPSEKLLSDALVPSCLPLMPLSSYSNHSYQKAFSLRFLCHSPKSGE